MPGSVLLTLAPLLVALFPPGDMPKTIPHKVLETFHFTGDDNSPLYVSGVEALVLRKPDDFEKYFLKVKPAKNPAVNNPGQNNARNNNLALPRGTFPDHAVLAFVIHTHDIPRYDKIQVSRLDDKVRIEFTSSVPEFLRFGPVDPLSSRISRITPLLLQVPAKDIEGAKVFEFLQKDAKPVVVKK